MAHIQHLAILSDDPEKLGRYYEDVFGWRRIRSGVGGGVHLSDGNINIAILKNRGGETGLNHFGVKLDSMDEVKTGLAKHGAEPEARPAGRAAEQRIVDPDGNEVDLSVQGFLMEKV